MVDNRVSSGMAELQSSLMPILVLLMWRLRHFTAGLSLEISCGLACTAARLTPPQTMAVKGHQTLSPWEFLRITGIVE